MQTAPIDLGDDDPGFVSVRLCGQEARIDLFAVHTKIGEFHKRHEKASDSDYNDHLVTEVIVPLGLPACSHATAIRFVQAIRKAVADLGNALSPPPASPGSSASTPGV